MASAAAVSSVATAVGWAVDDGPDAPVEVVEPVARHPQSVTATIPAKVSPRILNFMPLLATIVTKYIGWPDAFDNVRHLTLPAPQRHLPLTPAILSPHLSRTL